MATVRKTIRLTEETNDKLERRHAALVAAGKSETLSDTLDAILSERDREAPSGVNYTVIDTASLEELRREIVSETRLTSLMVIRETLSSEITRGFQGFVAAMRDDLHK